MAIVKDAVDAVVVGLGWSGSIMSIELARAGLKVRALESGPERTNAGHLYPKPADQLAYSIRQKVFARPRQMATTVRHNTDEVALPTRTWGAFKPGNRSRAVKGLYLAGGAAHPGPGMPMVMMSGWIAADSLDQDLGGRGMGEMARRAGERGMPLAAE